MKYLKKIVAFVMAAAITLVSSACTSGNSQEDFDQFLEGLPTRVIESGNFSLNFLFDDPSRFGFEEELLELPFATEEDYRQSAEDTDELLAELKSFNRSALTADQQLTYDILADYLERSLLTLDYYYLDNSYLGSFIGYQAQLPLLLNEYTLNRQNDLDSYFHILETAGDVFHQYAEMEKLRQENGVGMSRTILDKVIEQCDNFSRDENTFLIQTMNDKIDAADFLSADEKTAAKEKNESLLKTGLIPAYRTLGEELSTIDAPDSDLGLAHLPGGKEYYEALLKQSTGIDTGVEDLKQYFSLKTQKFLIQAQQILLENPELLDEMSEVTYSDFTSVEETMDYLAQRMLEDYPPIDNLNYTIHTVPESMKENFSPAAYLQSKIDKVPDDSEAIYINGEYDQSLFTTIAHEGYPGHMYQNVYFTSLELPAIRYLMDYNGYSEGWATYVELNSYQYGNDDPDVLELMRLNQLITQCQIAIMDIGIHYDGWDRQEFQEYFEEWFGSDYPQETVDEQYELILETPTNYLQYYLNGMYFQDLYDDAAEELGDQFSPVEFHRVILETGPSCYAILEAKVDAYVRNAKAA